MENQNFYACPYCNHEGDIIVASKLYDDIRYDSLRCQACGAEWRVYYRVGNFVAEITHPPVDTTEETTVEESTTAEKQENGENDTPKSETAE